MNKEFMDLAHSLHKVFSTSCLFKLREFEDALSKLVNEFEISDFSEGLSIRMNSVVDVSARLIWPILKTIEEGPYNRSSEEVLDKFMSLIRNEIKRLDLIFEKEESEEKEKKDE